MNNNNIPENEQWKLDGDCDKCRRNDYCSKLCTKFKSAENEVMGDILRTAYENAQKRVEAEKTDEEGGEVVEKDE